MHILSASIFRQMLRQVYDQDHIQALFLKIRCEAARKSDVGMARIFADLLPCTLRHSRFGVFRGKMDDKNQLPGFHLMDEQSSYPQTISLIADELRSLARNNLQYTDDPYQIQRNQRVLELAAQLQALTDTRAPEEIQRIFSQDLGYITPLAVADAVVIDPDGKVLLVRRADDGLWALPGGACDTGETPAEAAAREVWEESGYQVEITRLLGVFDSRLVGTRSSRHLYHLLFAAVPIAGRPTTSNETSEVGWFPWDAIPWETLSPGHNRRLQYAMQWWLNPRTSAYFDWEPYSPPGK